MANFPLKMKNYWFWRKNSNLSNLKKSVLYNRNIKFDLWKVEVKNKKTKQGGIYMKKVRNKRVGAKKPETRDEKYDFSFVAHAVMDFSRMLTKYMLL